MPSCARPDYSFDYSVEDEIAALRKRGLRRPLHSTRICLNILNDKGHDRIMFFPGPGKHEFTGLMQVVDFDGAVFRNFLETRTAAQFRAYLRYSLSDHRLLWAQFRI